MKLLNVGCSVALGFAGLLACDKPAEPTTAPVVAPADPAPAAEAATGDADAAAAGDEEAAKAEAEKAEHAPTQACTTLIGAATAKDDATFLANATEATAQALSDPSTKEMVYGLLGVNATCGESTIDGDKATVLVTTGSEKRDIPFVKISDAWKFDAAEYMNKYPPQPAKSEKPKKGAKGKAKGA